MKQKFYTVKMEFLIEAKDKAEATRQVTNHNFVKVMEPKSGWGNFTVGKVKQIKESELI
jgi:hypothetical protein